MIAQDVILIRLKMKEKNMTVKELAIKVHTTPNKLNNILNLKETSRIIEERIFKWLSK